MYGKSNGPNTSPCLGCKDRWVTENDRCHSSCEKYISWKKERKLEQKDAINPKSCRYFKTKLSKTASNTKHRYR